VNQRLATAKVRTSSSAWTAPARPGGSRIPGLSLGQPPPNPALVAPR